MIGTAFVASYRKQAFLMVGILSALHMSIAPVLDASPSSDDIPGGVTGKVFTESDSLRGEWVPLPDAVVIVEHSEGDSLISPVSAEIHASYGSVRPKMQVVQPGAPLRIIATGTRPTRLTARTMSGREFFTIALALPSLEVIKHLSENGIITLHNSALGADSVLARILVTPHYGWTKTDSGGVYLIPGIPPECHSVWCYDPMRGSAFDTVCVEPATAVSRDFFLPDFLVSEPDDGGNE